MLPNPTTLSWAITGVHWEIFAILMECQEINKYQETPGKSQILILAAVRTACWQNCGDFLEYSGSCWDIINLWIIAELWIWPQPEQNSEKFNNLDKIWIFPKNRQNRQNWRKPQNLAKWVIWQIREKFPIPIVFTPEAHPKSAKTWRYIGARSWTLSGISTWYMWPRVCELCARLISTRAHSSCTRGPISNLNPTRTCGSFGTNTCARTLLNIWGRREALVFGTKPSLLVGEPSTLGILAEMELRQMGLPQIHHRPIHFRRCQFKDRIFPTNHEEVATGPPDQLMPPTPKLDSGS